MAKASPGGRKPPKAGSPRLGNRQSRGPSKPTGKAPRPNAAGADPRPSRWGGHLQGNSDKGGSVGYQ